MTESSNPRARIGGNNPPEPIDKPTMLMMLREEYPALENEVSDLLEPARKLPKVIESDEQMTTSAKLAADIFDKGKEIEKQRKAVKDQHLRWCEVIDEFFNTQIERCAKRNKNDRPGAGDILQTRVSTYNNAKIAAEAERRRQAQEKADREAEQRRKEAEAATKAAEEAQAAANRARNPERIAERQQEAEKLAETAIQATGAAAAAEHQAHGAYIDTLAKPTDLLDAGDIGDGVKIKAKMEKYAEIVDSDKLDKNKLWAFISEDEKAKALRQWARNTGHLHQMDGALIGERPETKIRR